MNLNCILAGPLAVGLAFSAPAFAQDHAEHGGHGGPTMAGVDDAGHAAADADMSWMSQGAQGGYPMTREASGTAWQPDDSEHAGIHLMRGDWMFMGHVVLNGVYDRQQGPRGDEKTFASGMVMGMARRPVGEAGMLQFRAMLSPDPVMGKRGYPLLLASGETANGVDPLIDRQHPHDLVMELSASYSRRLTANDSVFLYAGLPGEPAFGPPAFMHRLSIMDSPEAPISHHWLDSSHITFGVVTAGYVHGNWKLEASRFRGREPDENRYDIETGALDSSAVRLAWNPTRQLSLQVSWADAKDVETLDPEDQAKWSASAIYTRKLAGGGWWSTTAAWGRRESGHEVLDAHVLESALRPNLDWTIFARAERTENNELTTVVGHHGPTYRVGKASVGVVRDWAVGEHAVIGLGGLYARNFVPGPLKAAYGSDRDGMMAFVRLKLE